MLIIPAIDIINGNVVRLQRGDFKKENIYSNEPLETALEWQKEGARLLHIVDLDGARLGRLENKEIITKVIKGVDIGCEVGGGLREESDIEYFIEQGAERVVIGTKAIEEPRYLKKIASRFGEKIAVSIDFIDGKVAKKGWQEKTELTASEMLSRVRAAGVKTVIVTDIATDGVLKGPNIEFLNKVLEFTDISVVASGGVSSLADVEKICKIKKDNLAGIIIGRALYEGKINLEEAIRVAQC